MGTLTCSRCGANTQADSIEEGRKRINHSIGNYLGKPCEDGAGELILTGKTKPQESPKPQETSKPSGKSKQQSIKTD